MPHGLDQGAGCVSIVEVQQVDPKEDQDSEDDPVLPFRHVLEMLTRGATCGVRLARTFNRGVESEVKECPTQVSTASHFTRLGKESPRRSKPDAAALARLLDEWMDGDETEQRETFAVLRRSLDEYRLEGYKLFA